MNSDACIRKELYPECSIVGGTAVFQGWLGVLHEPYDSIVGVCDHEVLLVMSPVMQPTGWRIVDTWVQLHLMWTFTYSGEPTPIHCSTSGTGASSSSVSTFMDFQRDTIKFIGVLTGKTEGAPVVVSTGIKFTSPLNLRTRRAHAYRSRRAKSPGRCSHRCGRVTLQGKVIWARAREKGYHLKFYLNFISPLLPHYWCRVAALLSQTSRDHRCGRVTWQVLPACWSSHLAGAHERNAFGPPLWSSCQAGTRKAEGSVALPAGTDPRTGQRAPTQEPALL